MTRLVGFLKCLVLIFLFIVLARPVVGIAQVESGSVGLEGRIGSPPPSTSATISLPINQTHFTDGSITVSGICPNGLLVKIFKNEVFSGAVNCERSSFSILIDLFSAQNDLIARVYDNLDQPGPDSNKVTVFFDDNLSGSGRAARISLTSNFAKRGANPKDELTWPIIVSGGTPPYAVSLDWGDGNTTLQSVSQAGEFVIKHIYKNSGIYKLVIKAVDNNGTTAFLQLVAVANGNSGQTDATASEESGQTRTVVLWLPMIILVAFIPLAFWLGKKSELKRIKHAIESNQRPF